MKKLSLMLVIALAISSLVACGDTEKTTKTEANKSSTETKQLSAGAKTSSANESKSITTSRTVDLGPNKPWQAAAPSRLKEWQDQGKTVYLWSDASEIEDAMIKAITMENPHKNEDLPKTAEYLRLFTEEVKKNVPNEDKYFDKLNAAVADMKSVNLDGAKSNIEEAKKLREAK